VSTTGHVVRTVVNGNAHGFWFKYLKEKDHVADLCVNWNGLKVYLYKWDGIVWCDTGVERSIWLRGGQVTGSYVHSSEL
jgi:hypothetical protein